MSQILKDLSGYVPYTGATSNVNLGSNSLTASNVSGTNTGDQLPTTSAISATTIDWSVLYYGGGLYTKTLSANTTFTFSNAVAGSSIQVKLTNTASNYTVTWPAAVKWPSGVAPTMTIGAKSDIYSFVYDGTNYFGTYAQDY